MRPLLRWAAAALCGGAVGSVPAQYRADDGPALERPQPAPAPAVQDIAPRFAEAFKRSGQPRVVLMWNRALTDHAYARVLDEEVTRETGQRASSASERLTQGQSETAKLNEGDSSDQRVKTVTRGRLTVEGPQRQSKLAERHAVVLQRAFMAEMNRGGMRFVDRALAIRNTAAAGQRQGADAQMLEIDALRAQADLLLEVLLVEDADAPAGYGFDVRAKDIRRGEELTTLYSRAIPMARSSGAGAWVPGAAGYEFRQPPAPPPPGPADIGAALARDLMLSLGGNLPPPVSPRLNERK